MINSVNFLNSHNFSTSTINNIKNKKNNISENFENTDFKEINNYKKDLVSFKGLIKKNKRNRHLNSFKIPYNVKLPKNHVEAHIYNNFTSSVLCYLPVRDYWVQTNFNKSKSFTPWKMHIYADTENDWAKLTGSVGRYLNTKPVTWKTLGKSSPVDKLNSSEKQKGKAFTIYPSSKEQFKELAHDIDYIIRLNNLEIKDSNIVGDRKLGTTGRIFYRYDHKSGATKDKIFSTQNLAELDEYNNNYDANRGENKYLAPDMTIEDDPFYTFDPQYDI